MSIPAKTGPQLAAAGTGPGKGNGNRPVLSAVTGGPVIGGTTPAVLNTIAATALEEPVRRDTVAARWPEYRAELSEVFCARARKQTEAAAALPLEPQTSITDRWAIENAEGLSTEVEQAKTGEHDLAEEHKAASLEFAETERPLGFSAKWGVYVLASILAIGVGHAIGFLMTSSIEAYLLHDWFVGLMRGRAEPVYSVLLSAGLSCLISVSMTVVQAVIFLAGRRVPFHVKVAVLVVELIFTAAFGATRLGDEFSFQAVAVTGLEIALLLVYSLALSVLGRVLSESRERQVPFGRLRRKEKTLRGLLRNAQERVRRLETQLARQVAALHEREIKARGAERDAALAEITAEAAYRVAACRAAAESLDDPAEVALAARSDQHLREVAARPLSPNHTVVKWK